MSRKRRTIAPPSSLFPFLSILACVIGVLALMIGALAPGQAEVRNKPVAPVQNDDVARLLEQIEFAEADIQRLEQRRVQAESVQAQLARSEKELNELKQRRQLQWKEAHEAAEQRFALGDEAELLRNETERLEPELAELDRRIARLKSEIAERMKPPPEAAIQVRAYHARRKIDPVFVECRKEGLVVYENDEPLEVPAAGIPSSAEFIRFLDRVAKTPDGAVVFMIRSDAFPTYFVARSVARERSCRNGKLPLVGEGPVDLSVVRKHLED